MFKTAARKIAHNSTMPGLAGKQDLRTLQDLITAEKAVLTSLQRLSTDFGRASDALRVWGQGEGDDLGDTLMASNALLMHFTSALNAFANHEMTIREEMKSVRTREENLDALKRRRKSVFSDAESAERKLSKMNPENKNLQQQTDLLNRLRDEIRTMDSDIMAEEASLGDFKRSTTRSWMGRKFGVLQECCEKGIIVGELGKLIISEIPQDQTQPGMPRPYYTGHARTEFLVAEAARSVSEVQYSSEPNSDPSHRTIRPLPGNELSPVPSPSQRGLGTNGNPYVQMPNSPPQPGQVLGLPQVEESGFSIPQFGSSEQSPINPPVSSVNEFGTLSGPPPNQSSSFNGMPDPNRLSGPRGGRFATFPVKAQGPRPPPGPGSSTFASTNPYINAPPMNEETRAPSLDIQRNEESFSSSVALALGDFSMDGPSGSQPGSSTGGVAIPPPTHAQRKSVEAAGDFGQQRYSPPPPMYTPSHNQGLPVGAAPSQPPSAMYSDLAAHDTQRQPDSRPLSSLHNDEDELAYMSSRGNESSESLSEPGRKVHFGAVSDMDQEMEKRKGVDLVTPRPGRVPVPPLEENIQVPPLGRSSPEVSRSPPQTSPVRDGGQSIPHVTTPPVPDDEQSLNAAAAREVTRELDALMMSTPTQLTDRAPPSPHSPVPPYGVSPYQKRDYSPQPSPTLPQINTTQPMNTSQTSPRMDGYVRARDRSVNSPALSRTPQIPEAAIPTPASPTHSDSSEQRPSISMPRASPVPSAADATPGSYRTPIGSPLSPPPTGSLYNLSGGTGSTPSITGIAGGAPRTISAAAFRRPQPVPRGSLSDVSAADTSPLNVKKRSLPSTPYGAVPQPPAMTTPYGGDPDRAVSMYRQDGEDDFDISAYTEGNERASAYGTGRYPTNYDGHDGIR